MAIATLRIATASIAAAVALGFSCHEARAEARLLCFAKVSNGPDRIIGAYNGPDGQIVGHASVGTLLGEVLTDQQPREGFGFFTAQWVNLSKSYGRLQDSLWYRKDDLRCELRGGF